MDTTQGFDSSYYFWLGHVKQAAVALQAAMRTFDETAACSITVAPDVGFPSDSMRLAAGFPTGCFLSWVSRIPLIPVDANVNVDTSSLYWLKQSTLERFTLSFFTSLIDQVKTCSSYIWNFDSGNHFISLARSQQTGRYALILHSNEKEFKYQHNGLSPTPHNWYASDVHKTVVDGFVFRLLVGPKVDRFVRMANMLKTYNVVRHNYFCGLIADGVTDIESETHHHHYYMPSPTSIAMGAYLCAPGEVVPVFSRAGRPITLFKARSSNSNRIFIEASEKYLVPHGWGRAARSSITLSADPESVHFNGRTYCLSPNASVTKHPDLALRDYSDDPHSNNYFFKHIAGQCPGDVVDVLTQIAAYHSEGVTVY